MTLYRSSIGKKAVMALTGAVLVGFVVFHMYGNLKIFYGPQTINEYAAGLRELGHPVFGHEHLLWVARLVLLASVVLHIASAVQLSRQSLAGRPSQYARREYQRASFASRTIRWGGLIIFLFILYHLLHFTFGVVGYDATRPYTSELNGQYDVYSNVIRGFQFWPASLVYILAMGAVALHLFHGVWSMFQTLGLNNGTYTSLWRGLSVVVAVAVFVGNVSIPLAVLTGVLK
jgi:succinate dehydrogenase / fumarate reductase cytochrome b subunit